MSYVFHPAAETEYLESIGYFESKCPGLGASYLAEFESTMAKVCESPHRYPVEKPLGVRCIRMERFPYAVLYREMAGIIQVLAVAHHRRRPGYWLGRI
ncbi:MAG: type II toxin-antitoxin system RelE/ParE family toxin [Gammaproteobacteria bacterium]|nr:type II toxin-antitoxin system RelE/ParE family toxin [Gammaproteobacteria bacterium]